MKNTSGQLDNVAAFTRANRNVWPIFISYRRNDATRKIALELKKELEASTIEATTGQIFALDVFVDVAEAHQSDFQANLVPHLQHSRALIVLADDGAASRKNDGSVDYLYSELDWWATERKKTPPIILQIDAKSGSRLVADPQFVAWRKVSFVDCFWEKWANETDAGKAEKQQLLAWLRESIRNYGLIVHLDEVRRLKRRALIASLFAGAALFAGLAAGILARYYSNEKITAQNNLVAANNNLADSFAQRGESLAQVLDFTTSQLFFARALELKPDGTIRGRMSQAWRPQPRWLWTAPPPGKGSARTNTMPDMPVSMVDGPTPQSFFIGYSSGNIAVCDSSGSFHVDRQTPSSITSLTFIKDLSQLITAHADKHLRIWNADNLEFIKEISLKSKPLVVRVSPDEKLIAVGYSDAGIEFFSIHDFEAIDSADAHGMGVSAIAFDAERNVAYWAGGGEYVWIYDFQEKAAQRAMPKRGWTSVLALQPFGTYLNVGGEDRIVGLIDLEKNQSIKAAENDSDISASSFSPDSQTLAVGDVSGKICLFSMTLGKAFANLPLHPGSIKDLLITEDGTIISACSDGCLRGWTLPLPVTRRFKAPITEMQKVFERFKKETGQNHILDVKTGRYDSSVVGVIFKSSDAPLEAFLSDGKFCRWEQSSGSPKTTQLTGPPLGQSVSAATDRIAVLTPFEMDLEVYDVKQPEVPIFKENISKESGPYTPVAISSDGNYVACALMNGAVKCWAINDRKLHITISTNGSPPATISLSSSADAIAVGYRNGQAAYKYAKDDSPAVVANLDSNPVISSFLVDSSHVLFGTSKRLYCYDPTANKTRWEFNSTVISFAVDPRKQWILCGTSGGEIHVLDLKSGSKIITFESESEGAECVAFDKSGNFIAWGDRRGRTFIRSIETLRTIYSATPSSLLTVARQNGGFVIKGADVQLLGERRTR